MIIFKQTPDNTNNASEASDNALRVITISSKIETGADLSAILQPDDNGHSQVFSKLQRDQQMKLIRDAIQKQNLPVLFIIHS